MSFVLPTTINYGPTQSAYMPWDKKENVVPKWIQLADAHGGSYESIGKNSKGWDIILFKFGNPNAPAVMIDAHLHGNEYYGHESLYTFINWLVTSTDTYAKHILANNLVLVVPCVNYRWGRTNYNVPTYFSMTAKDPADGATCGINLNRNFSPSWSNSLRTANSDGCSGDHADSELEAQALKNAWTKYKPRIYYNLHQGSSTSTSTSASTTQATADITKTRSVLPAIAASLGAPTWSIGSPHNGSGFAKDGSAKAGCAGFMTELRSGWSNGAAVRVELNSGNIYKGFKALVIAMCQAVEGGTPPTTQYTLTVSIGAGSGTVSPTQGAHTYPAGAKVSCVATPSGGYLFSRWLINGVTVRNATVEVTMNSNTTAEARFFRPKLTILPNNNGTTNPVTGDYIVDAGTSITVTATANVGYKFDYWTLDGNKATSNPVTVIIDKDHVLKPFFVTGESTGLTITADSTAQLIVLYTVNDVQYTKTTPFTVTLEPTDTFTINSFEESV